MTGRIKHSVAVFLGALAVWLAVLGSSPVNAQGPLDALRILWRGGSYVDVIPLLVDFRATPYGRRAEVDYMIATSACRIDSMREDGYRRLERLIYDHSLDAEARHLVDNEKSKCGRPDAPILIASLRRHAWVGVSGEKTYYFIREDNPLAHPLGSRPARILREIPYNEITSRRFPLGERETAVARTKELVGADFKVQGIGPFVLATRSSHSSEQLQAIAAMLGVFRQFLIGTYEMAVPESLITVYLVPHSYELWRLAENIHGIRVTDLAIGYSYQDDLSVVGAIPGPVIGTLLHELFHLMVRADFGDVPAWLDEALASLYEVSKQSNGRFDPHFQFDVLHPDLPAAFSVFIHRG